MPSTYHRRFRKHSRAAVALGRALLITAVCGPISVAAAQTDASEQRQKLEHLRDVNADARRNADELRRQMDEMQAEATDQGLLLTVDDALFVTNDVGLSSIGRRRLDALAEFLGQHPERTVAVAWYAGADGPRYDRTLAKRRAHTVQTHLIERGTASRRLTMRGNGESPQDYDSATRQQPQRQVEVLIVDPLTSVPQPSRQAPCVSIGRQTSHDHLLGRPHAPR